MYDVRTGRRQGSSSGPTEAWMLRELVRLWRQDRLGKRRDLHELLPHLDVTQSSGTQVGDIIAPHPHQWVPGTSDWCEAMVVRNGMAVSCDLPKLHALHSGSP